MSGGGIRFNIELVPKNIKMYTPLPKYARLLLIPLLSIFFVACDAPSSAAEAEAEQAAQTVDNPDVNMATDYSAERQEFFTALENFYAQDVATPEDVYNVFIQLTEASLSLAQAYDPAKNPGIARYAEAVRNSYAQIDVEQLDTQSESFATAAINLSELLQGIATRYYPNLSVDANLLHRGAVRIVPDQPILGQDAPLNTFFQSAEKVLSGMSSPVLEVEAEEME